MMPSFDADTVDVEAITPRCFTRYMPLLSRDADDFDRCHGAILCHMMPMPFSTCRALMFHADDACRCRHDAATTIFIFSVDIDVLMLSSAPYFDATVSADAAITLIISRSSMPLLLTSFHVIFHYADDIVAMPLTLSGCHAPDAILFYQYHAFTHAADAICFTPRHAMSHAASSRCRRHAMPQHFIYVMIATRHLFHFRYHGSFRH